MKCENDKELITRWINNELSEAERNAFEIHVAGCAECRQELKATEAVWNLMGEVHTPQPSADMPLRFQAMLEDFKEAQKEKASSPINGFFEKLRQLWSFQPGMQLAYTIVLIVMGVGFGYFINRQDNAGVSRQEMVGIIDEMREMKKTVTLALLENPSASERIRGVSYTSEIKTVSKNREVIEALLSTLNTDPNVNVRLVTLEALTQYADDAAVRTGLVQSIVQQDSPIMQAAMADVMLKLKDKRSVDSFKKLLQQKDLDHSIRNKLEQTITGII
jgi:anti-sigma factor ChrR (cupin superfamily)